MEPGNIHLFLKILFLEKWLAPAVRWISLQVQAYGSFGAKTHFLEKFERLRLLKNSLDGAQKALYAIMDEKDNII